MSLYIEWSWRVIIKVISQWKVLTFLALLLLWLETNFPFKGFSITSKLNLRLWTFACKKWESEPAGRIRKRWESEGHSNLYRCFCMMSTTGLAQNKVMISSINQWCHLFIFALKSAKQSRWQRKKLSLSPGKFWIMQTCSICYLFVTNHIIFNYIPISEFVDNKHSIFSNSFITSIKNKYSKVLNDIIISLKLVSATFYQVFIFYQMTALQKL